jgi:hypothetical protein
MANLQRLLRRRPEIDEAELELSRTRTLARLSALRNGGAAVSTSNVPELDGPVEATELELPPATDEVFATAGADPTNGDGVGLAVAVGVRPAVAVGVRPAVAVMDVGPGVAVMDVGPGVGGDGLSHAGLPEQADGPSPDHRTPEEPRTGVRAKRTPVRVGPKARRAVPVPRPVGASCPYCAVLLQPPPEASRRCPRCRQRIVVKHVDRRAVYLTEAAVSVFDAERWRNANSARWTRERQRWLKLAAAAGASARRAARLDAAPLSEEVVTASQALYVTTVERSYRSARHARRWGDASRIMRDHALALFRIAGSPIPPPEAVVQLHREGTSGALHDIGEVAREAELVGGTCCDACRADDGRVFRISQELRVPRLPHEGCPKGLCGCRWSIAVRDRTIVQRYLRR